MATQDIIDAIDTQLEALATSGKARLTINGRTVEYSDPVKLLEVRAAYAAQLRTASAGVGIQMHRIKAGPP